MAEAVLVASALISAGGQIQAGNAARKAASKTAAMQEFQGRLAQQEADAQAAKTEKEAKKFRDRQILAYLKNGVTLEGSPLLVLDETIKLGDEEAAAIRKRGYATQELYNTEAGISRRTGSAQFISGITGATSTAGTAYFNAFKKS